MKKILTMIAAFFALFYSTNIIFAASGDYKNNLLKIEVNKVDEGHYDIGLYTQKIYNEPVKIIKKTDTIYYFLLPETSNSVTSVPSAGDIKNVLVKTYPYAGQDASNGYTKVAIITSKPVNLTTSLRTLDPSVSPRLDPMRLARLDKVFERYSERLAENNIQSPLNEFRKTASVQRPALESNVTVKNKENVIASNQKTTTSSLEEYQTKLNKAQAAQKQAAQKAAVKTSAKPVQKTVVKTPVISTNLQKTIQKAVQKQAVQKTTTPVKAAAPAKVAAPVKAAAPVKTVQAPVKQAQKVQQKPVSIVQTVQKAVQPVQKTAQTQTKTVQTQQKQTPVKLASAPVSAVKQPQKQLETLPVKTKDIIPPETKETKEATKQSASADKLAEEYQKQLATTKPVDAEFGRKVPVEKTETAKNIKAELVEPIENAPVQNEIAENLPAPNVPAEKNTQNNNNLLVLGALFMFLLVLYAAQKKNSANKKKAAELLSRNSAREAGDIKELLKKRTAIKHETIEEEQAKEAAANAKEESQIANNTYEQTEIQSAVTADEPLPINEYSDEEEKIEAFNRYMENISEADEIESETAQEAPVQQTEEEVIAELYTPIDDNLSRMADYTKDEPKVEEAKAEKEQAEIAATAQEEADSDVATIVSSSKLTETRGLYLAKFEGSTSLVGYIQDDIYVLYNFGDVNIQDTEIESRLAQENDTDSLYIVKTGGKKLMVKSTPYDLSLEMVM